MKRLPSDEACVLLDMSVYQLSHMDKLPAYAIINDAVEITRKQIHGNMAKLVSAVLYAAQRRGRREITGKEEEALAIRTSHPTWLVQMRKAQYGQDNAQKICEADMETKPNAARVNTWKVIRGELMKQGSFFQKGHLNEDALLYDASLAATLWYTQGLLFTQDEASQLTIRIVDPQKREQILDVRSAQGTKTNHMAELMWNDGSIVCDDIHEHKVELIREGTARLGITALKPQAMSATEFKGAERILFDRVLCDVPRSGYGVLARESDIKVHMQSGDMNTLIPIQKAILTKSTEHVKEHGILVYSTCTLNKKENEKQVQTFLREHENFILIEERAILPYTAHTDGFYAAKLQRVS